MGVWGVKALCTWGAARTGVWGVRSNSGLTVVREDGELGIMPRRWGVNGCRACVGTGGPLRSRTEAGEKSPGGSCPLAWKAANEVRACSSALNPRYGGAELG